MATDFFYQIKGVLGKNREGSYSTQIARAKILSLIDKQLKQLGFRNLQLKGMKPKHINSLLEKWKSEGLSISTIKNRMCQLRWLTKKIGKSGIIPNSNAVLGIPSRIFITNKDLSRKLDQEKLNLINDENIIISLKLQMAFGLRREECLKFNPDVAVQGDIVRLKPSWCKGNRGRDIPIITEKQRLLLNDAKSISKGGSMIPSDLSYVQQLKKYEYQCLKIGLSKAHGLRHLYAQERYIKITNMMPRSRGGVLVKNMTGDQKKLDVYARSIITKELGHGRSSVTSIYLGGTF
jgi:hypothetical protein